MQLSDLQASLQSLGYGTDTAAQQILFLNSAYREIHSSQRWPFLEALNQAQSTAVGTANYTPPMTNWRNFDAVRIDKPASNLFADIDYMQPQDLMDRLHDDPATQTTGTPQYWTFYAQQVWFYPTPDDVYRISYYYITEPADMSAPSDVPLIPIAYHDAIVAGAICRIAFRERDWIGLELWTQKYQQLVTSLREEYLLSQRQTSSEVKRSGFFDNNATWPVSSSGL